MEVRLAQNKDLGAINEIENDAIVRTFAHFGLDAVPLADTEAAFASAGGHPWVVAVEEGLVGFARASAWKPRRAYERTCEVGIYVRDGRQGRGIGRALYEDMLPRLQEAGFHTVLAGIALPNEASVRLHEAMGFRYAGTFPEVGFKFGEWRSVGYWTLTFSEP